jgi:hypothetical protein
MFECCGFQLTLTQYNYHFVLNLFALVEQLLKHRAFQINANMIKKAVQEHAYTLSYTTDRD